MNGSAQPPRTPRPQRPINTRLRDLPLHRDTLVYEFGDDFSLERFVAAVTSNDPAARAKVLAVERGFEILMNNLTTELTVAAFDAAGYPTPGTEPRARSRRAARVPPARDKEASPPSFANARSSSTVPATTFSTTTQRCRPVSCTVPSACSSPSFTSPLP